jgi:hypothetical protein
MAGVLSVGELTELLDRFGVKVKVDLAGAAADGVSPELVTARLAHALVGVVEAHATRAEDAARRAGAGAEDIGEVALMAFAGASCGSEAGTHRPGSTADRGGCHRRARGGSVFRWKLPGGQFAAGDSCLPARPFLEHGRLALCDS